MLARVIKLNHVRTHCQLADLLTKALGYKQFSELISKIGLINIYSPSVHLEGECQSPNSAATCVSGVTLMQPQLHHNAVDNAAATEQPRLHQTKQEF